MFNATWLYVGVIYAIAVWLVRRVRIDLPWRIAAFFYLLVLIFLWRPLTTDVVNLPVDFLRSLPPWAFLTRFNKPINPEINDLVLQIVPWANQVRESWRSGHVPLWNNLSGSGYPLLASAQSSALSPLRLLALALPLGQSFAAEAAMKFLIAMTFTFLFCRRRYSEIASATAAVCFAFCSFVVVWLHFPLGTVAVFVPAALYQIELIAERRTYPRFLFAAALWAVMIFCGHPETVAHIFFISFLLVAWLVFVERPFATTRDALRFLATLTGALAVAALLASPFLAPFAEAITKSKRFSELQSRPNVIGYYSDWPSVVLLLQPRFFGSLPFEKTWVTAPSAESITGFAGILGIAAWFALLMHVIRTRAWRSREFFLVIASLIVLGIILGWPGISQLFHLIFKLAANARLRLLLCFLVAVMTAAMIDLMMRDLRAFLGGIAVCCVLLVDILFFSGVPEGAPHLTAVMSLMPSLLVLAIATLATAFGDRAGRALAAGGTPALLFTIILEVWSATAGWNPTIRAEEMYPETPLIAKLQTLKTKEPFRIVGTGPIFFPNTPAMFGLEDIRAHDPMANGRYLGMLRVLTGYDTENYFPKWKNVETRVLDYLNVKYVVVPPRAEMRDVQRYALVYDGRDGRIFENRDVLPRFYPVHSVILEFNNSRFMHLLQTEKDWAHTALLKSLPVSSDRERNDLLAPRAKGTPDATMRITRASGDDFQMTGHAPRHTFIVSSIPWWPGWKVVSNGRTLTPLHVNGAFLGFVVPPGKFDVHVWYSPMTFRAGVWVALATVIGICGSAVLVRARRRASAAD